MLVCMFKHVCPLLLEIIFMCYLDNGLVIYNEATIAKDVQRHFQKVYPAHLPFSIEIS